MFPKPFLNAAPKISNKRKRAPRWPFATRGTLELAIAGLIDNGTVRELDPPSEWRVHPSTEARGSGFQHERIVWGLNDGDEWSSVKIRQHAQDPSRTAGRTGFEGGDVSDLNTNLSELLRTVGRGGGQRRDGLSPARQVCKEDGKVHGRATGTMPSSGADEERPFRGRSSETSENSRRYKDKRLGCSSPKIGADRLSRGMSPPYSADEAEELAAADAGARGLGVCPSPGCSSRSRRSSYGQGTRGREGASDAAIEADAFIASVLRSFPGARNVECVPNSHAASPGRASGRILDSWENYMEKPIVWFDAGPSPAPDPGSVVQWFSFVPKSPSQYSDLSASSPSHVSNSYDSSDNDTPSSVPSTVPEGLADWDEGSSGDGSVESG